MDKHPNPSKSGRLPARPSPERLHKNLRRLRLMIPIDAVGLALCIGSLIIEGYDTLLCALAGLLGTQLLFFILLRRDLLQQLATAEEFIDENDL